MAVPAHATYVDELFVTLAQLKWLRIRLGKPPDSVCLDAEPHSAIYREEEREMMPMLKHFGVGVVPWGPIATGCEPS